MMLRFVAVLVAAFALGVPTSGRAATWELDPGHTSVQFSVRHLMVSNVRGEFGKISGVVHVDDADISKSTIEATIDVASITTRNEKRDEHLRSPDFFDAAKYPTITFKSTKAEKTSSGWKVTGDLTMHGVTKPVVLDVEGPTPEMKDPWGNARAGAQATTKVDRQDFGISWNKALDAGGVTVGNEVSVTIDVEAVKKK
jgi:polyisoprenoid-binding protein YceI